MLAISPDIAALFALGIASRFVTLASIAMV
jgi:hypothetical protein